MLCTTAGHFPLFFGKCAGVAVIAQELPGFDRTQGHRQTCRFPERAFVILVNFGARELLDYFFCGRVHSTTKMHPEVHLRNQKRGSSRCPTIPIPHPPADPWSCLNPSAKPTGPNWGPNTRTIPRLTRPRQNNRCRLARPLEGIRAQPLHRVERCRDRLPEPRQNLRRLSQNLSQLKRKERRYSTCEFRWGLRVPQQEVLTLASSKHVISQL